MLSGVASTIQQVGAKFRFEVKGILFNFALSMNKGSSMTNLYSPAQETRVGLQIFQKWFCVLSVYEVGIGEVLKYSGTLTSEEKSCYKPQIYRDKLEI